ncbi:oligogalacturonate lyase family protein [Marinomonas profundimaris]|uniref:Oligogalacturonate lyase n=1 Tax=Marinomonas profundimaris TaxID=1208321 RepID=W1RUP3_9GAMM|nr:oligogalacturonate lyase family protein [Marinomonas profundimaris]ETI60535.1 oligogalacturonate lyase [Marinomonas profundimaris]
MSLGKTTALAFQRTTDVNTGSVVTQLTPDSHICNRNYFYQKCFTNDGNKLLISADFDAHRNYHLLDLQTETATQLTEGKGDNVFGGFLTTQDDALIFVKNNLQLMRVDLKTQEHSVLYEVAKGWVGYGTWVPNTACTKVVGIEIKESDYMELDSWGKFAQFYHQKPRCRLISINLKTGQRTTVFEENIWLGHPLYRPNDDNTVAFCHEGPHDLIETRMWMIDENGDNMRKVYEQSEEESCTHEFFVPDGSKMMFVSYRPNTDKRQLCSVNASTLDFKVEIEMPACSHLMSNNDGTMVVGDGSGTPVDVADNTGHGIENDPNLYLIDLTDASIRPITEHNTSWKVLNGDRQINHPHPSFSPDNKSVLYSSDVNGTPAIYLATL